MLPEVGKKAATVSKSPDDGTQGTKTPTIEWIKLSFQVATVLLALAAFFISLEKERHERFQTAYRALADSYHHILELVREKRKLDAFDVAIPQPEPLTADEEHEQRVLYAMLINHFEQAYTLLRTHQKYWPGWDAYIDSYLRRARFRNFWKEVRLTWGDDFREYMDQRLAALEKGAVLPAPATPAAAP